MGSVKVVALLRHGKSDWEPLGVSDFNRPLSERGIRDILQQGQALLKTGYRPDRILSSPAIRAWHTAHLLAQVVSLPHEAVQSEIGFYREDEGSIEATLQVLSDDIATVVLVGHNPLWSEIASRWAGESIELATSELIAFGWEGSWETLPFRQILPRLFYLRRAG